ncbi:hypothetical protein ACRRTK_009253 [Alexandromys fortis]
MSFGSWTSEPYFTTNRRRLDLWPDDGFWLSPAPTSSHRSPPFSTPAETGILHIVHTGSAFVLAS